MGVGKTKISACHSPLFLGTGNAERTMLDTSELKNKMQGKGGLSIATTKHEEFSGLGKLSEGNSDEYVIESEKRNNAG